MGLFAILAAAAAAAGPAGDAGPAAPPAVAPPVDPRFARLDRNGDGVITANEAPRVVRTRCDCTGATAPPAAGSWLAGYDRDGDARITPQEFAARAAAAPPEPVLARADPPLR